MNSCVKFFNGHKMPFVGFGTAQQTPQNNLEDVINEALTVGYRHFDTAYWYMTEKSIGNVLKVWLESGKVKREELFIVTKLPFCGNRPEDVSHFLEKSLKNLGLTYIDLYLIHWPIGIKYVTDDEIVQMKAGKLSPELDLSTDLELLWKSMELQVDKGLAKSIGISNFNFDQIERIFKIARIPPANIQVELHAYFQQKELRELCQRLGLTICAYAPLGSLGMKPLFEKLSTPTYQTSSLMEDPEVIRIANDKGKTPAQILLRFLIQKNIVVIPKSINFERIKQNFEILDFELTCEQITRLEKLDKGEAGRLFHFENLWNFGAHPEYPFK